MISSDAFLDQLAHSGDPDSDAVVDSLAKKDGDIAKVGWVFRVMKASVDQIPAQAPRRFTRSPGRTAPCRRASTRGGWNAARRFFWSGRWQAPWCWGFPACRASSRRRASARYWRSPISRRATPSAATSACCRWCHSSGNSQNTYLWLDGSLRWIPSKAVLEALVGGTNPWGLAQPFSTPIRRSPSAGSSAANPG